MFSLQFPNLEEEINKVRNNLFQVQSLTSSLSPLVESSELRSLLGRAASTTVQQQKGYPPLVKAYARRKLKKVGAKPPLVYSGKTLAGLISGELIDIRLAGNSRTIEVRLGGLAALHQIGAGNLPVRHELEANEELAAGIAGEFNEKLGEGLAGILK